MNSLVVRAMLDTDGRLIAADEPLATLNRRAGGHIGRGFAIPQLAQLARIAIRTKAPVARPIVAGDHDHDVTMWGRFIPTPDGVRIEIADWAERPKADLPTPMEAYAQPDQGIRFDCDARLRLTRIDGNGNADMWLGRSLSELFHMVPDHDGTFPLLRGLADQRAIVGQKVRLAAGIAGIRADEILVLSAEPVSDEKHLVGFTGQVGAPMRPTEQALPGLFSIDPKLFSKRIDGALRRPLGRIIANAETISLQLDGPIRDDYARYAGDIADAGRHLLDLIDDLADLQAIERSDFSVARESVDLADVARRGAGLLAMKARERRIRIDVPLDDEKAMAIGEFRRVLQIVLNLIGNAVRYSPDGSSIWLRVESDDDHASITVADQGAGIAPEDQTRLFEKFERLGRMDTSGSGLGLYIARRLAHAMDGDISVESALGQGARFTLTLPRDRRSAERPSFD